MNLKAIATVISLLPGLVNLVAETVKAVETSLEGFSGSDKFKAVETQVNSIVTAAVQDVGVLTDLQAALGPIINGWVAAFNAIGLFKKSASVPPVAGS